MAKKFLVVDAADVKANVVSKVKGQAKKAQKRVKLEQKPDTFEKQADNLASQTVGIEFKTKKVIFSPEDIEKMKSMSVEDRIAYKRALKKAGKYKVED